MRPPTEALASFFLTLGGMAFMLSTEELSIAAMRRGRDGALSVSLFGLFVDLGVW